LVCGSGFSGEFAKVWLAPGLRYGDFERGVSTEDAYYDANFLYVAASSDEEGGFEESGTCDVDSTDHLFHIDEKMAKGGLGGWAICEEVEER
jgi:hypothetical protein